ncbi:nucleotidyltransferase family protein [Leptospira koniambonensis]|nr:nucleotidyltransferase family protein [Leptospira koniambonensis]
METLQRYGVEHIGLFGSFARNDFNPESDIDILVEFSSGQKTFPNYMGLKIFLEDLFNRKIDLVIKEKVKPRLKARIIDETIYAA